MRRKFTLFITSLALATITEAQILKGSVLLGGSLGFTTTKRGTPAIKQTSLTVAPAAGVAIRDNTILGGSLIYGDTKYADAHDYSVYGAGIFMRQYKPLGKGFYLFAEGTISFDYTKATEVFASGQNPYIYEIQNYSVGLGVNPGISYALSKRLQLELAFNDLVAVNYTWGEREGITPPFVYTKTQGFSLASNLSLNGFNSLGIGFRFLINR